MSNMRARSLPRVREALEKAERARFYKQRTNKYTDEVRLMKAMSELEKERIAALARIKERTMDLRMQALHIRDEEKAYLEADEAGFDELKRKIQINKQRNFLQEVKYKPRRTRDAFIRRYELWKAEDAAEEDWRVEMPPRQPKVKLNEQLIYPAKRERKQNRRQYLEITRRPDSKLGAKALLRLRDLYSDDQTETDRLFFEELEQQLSARSDAADSQLQQAPTTQWQPMTERFEQRSEESPFVTQQLVQMQAVQNQAMQRILGQIESTRRSIRFWEVPISQWSREKLDECYQRRRYRIKRRKQKPSEENHQPDDEFEVDLEKDDELEEDQDTEVSVRLKDRMKKNSKANRQDHLPDNQTSSESDGETTTTASIVADEEHQDRVRKLSKRLSRGFRPDDFKKRRQSLMHELDEEGVSPEERQRRMREFEQAWTEVLKCKYIRGYEPPEMRLPEGQTATDFVFGEAQARVLDKIVEEAAATSATVDAADQEPSARTDDLTVDKPEAETGDEVHVNISEAENDQHAIGLNVAAEEEDAKKASEDSHEDAHQEDEEE